MDLSMGLNGGQPGPIVDDEQAFLDDVERFQKSRGVPFDREGKVAGRPAPLHKLFKVVTGRGGYDAVTAARMQWREVCAQFDFPAAHEGAMSYQMKQLYYKSLLAYEIEKYWHEVAPPKEILELLTAKGGEVRRRAREARGVFDDRQAAKDIEQPPQSTSNSAQLTPKQEPSEPDDQGSASRYPSRLRTQPRQAQPFQSEMTPTRRLTRNTNSPQPHQRLPIHPANHFRDANFKWEDYEPRPAMPLTLQPVITPGSNPELFQQRKQALKQKPISRLPLPQDLLRHSLSPAAFAGPNIYVRCVQGLRSELRSEQDFALHHLVKVSHERGDKFKFEGFPYLAEGLMEKVLEITELAFKVTFQVSYLDTRGQSAYNVINAVHGTQNLVKKLRDLESAFDESQIEPEDYIEKLEKLNEAALVLRNMVTLEENAFFLSKIAFFKDILIILINLPKESKFDEMRQYGLDMSEMVTKYWNMTAGDDLYLSLVQELGSHDRGKVIPALRAIYRFDAEADRIHPITGIPLETVERLVQFCILEDDELVEAVINFLYVWTSSHENLTWIIKIGPKVLPNIMFRFSQLLLNNATQLEISSIYERAPHPSQGLPPSIPIVPAELYAQLLSYAEPERSSRWLRCCFEEAATSDVTQISIWQAYSSRFSSNQPMSAAEFIKNVSSTLTGAQAQVVPGPEPNKPRFIIKGIRPRRVLTDMNGRPCFKCHWRAPVQPNADATAFAAARVGTCATWHTTADSLATHMIADHFKIPRTAEGKFPAFNDVTVPGQGWQCQWIYCDKSNPITSPEELIGHVRQHIPENAEQGKQIIYELAGETLKLPGDKKSTHVYFQTTIDEKGIACGIPYMTCLLLMNLARYVGRHGGNERQRRELMGTLFHPVVSDNLFDMWSKQKTIAALIFDLLGLIEAGKRPDQKTASA